MTFAEILDLSDDPRRAAKADWICADCRAAVALKFGLCGRCWLRQWKETGVPIRQETLL